MLADPAPMSVREAIEAAKIITPHLAVLRQAEGGFDLTHRLLDLLYGDHPAQPFRFLSLAHHMTMDDLAAALEPEGGRGVALALTQALVANPLPDLMNFAFLVGVSSEGWNG